MDNMQRQQQQQQQPQSRPASNGSANVSQPTPKKAPEWRDLKGDWVDVNSYATVCKADGSPMAALSFSTYEGKSIASFDMNFCRITQLKKLNNVKTAISALCHGEVTEPGAIKEEKVQFEVELEADILKITKGSLLGGGTFRRCRAFPTH